MSQDSTNLNNSNVSSVTSSNLNPTRRNNPCPVCGNTTGKCRTRDGSSLILCGNNHDSIQGWDYLGDAENPLWGKFLPSGEKPSPAAISVVPEPREIMPAQQKHEGWLQWINEKRLRDRELQELQMRNLSPDEIEYLATMSRSQMYFDRSNDSTYPSMVIPFMDVNGRFAGAQRRICGEVDGGRYRWVYLSGQQNLNNEHLEKPLAVYPAQEKGICWLVEGTGIKPAIASRRFSRYVIGAATGLHYNSPQTLRESIPDGAKVVLVPDAGDAINEDVVRRIIKNMRFLDSEYSVKILWWGQFTKDDSDIDEIDNLEEARSISLNEFLELVPQEILKKLHLDKNKPMEHQERVLNELSGVEPPHSAKTDGEGLSAFCVESVGSSQKKILTERELIDFQEYLREDPIFDPYEYLPDGLAGAIDHDAEIKNIDPVSIWQYILPGVASLMGRESYLDFPGFPCKNIVWSLIVQRSGHGKSRAESIVAPWFIRQDIAYKEDYDRRKEEWKLALKSCKGKDTDSIPPRPKRRKYCFEIATPQSVTKQLSDQQYNGVVWYRDEFKGLIRSLDQFTGEGEGLEILLKTYDGGGSLVDRVDEENSYTIPDSRLSLGGGLQPSMIAKTFSLEDGQGVLARFNIALPRDLEVKRIKGCCVLPQLLPDLFHGVENMVFDRVEPTESADNYFTEIVETFGRRKTYSDSEDAWFQKLAGKTGRIALVLHAIECFYTPGKKKRILEKDTLHRAYKLSLYYEACYIKMRHSLYQENIGLSGVMKQVVDRIERYGPQNPADLYRNINTIRTQAKSEGMRIGDFTALLLEDMEEKGCIVREEKKVLLPGQPTHQHKNTESAAP